MNEEENHAIDSAARLIADSSYVVALVGSGMSVESGIPTFRGPGGLWTRVGEPSMRGYEDFLSNPRLWWENQLAGETDPVRIEFRDAIDAAKPNAGHFALAELEQLGFLQFTITQNIDDLHFVAGSRAVIEIHGNRTKLRCIGCEGRWRRHEFKTDEYPPQCPDCGDLVKGDTVMFGEPIPPGVLRECFRETGRSDCMIAIGTSATVYPAASFPDEVKRSGGVLIEINTSATPLTGISDVSIRGSSGEVLPMIVERLKEISGLGS